MSGERHAGRSGGMGRRTRKPGIGARGTARGTGFWPCGELGGDMPVRKLAQLFCGKSWSDLRGWRGPMRPEPGPMTDTGLALGRRGTEGGRVGSPVEGSREDISWTGGAGVRGQAVRVRREGIFPGQRGCRGSLPLLFPRKPRQESEPDARAWPELLREGTSTGASASIA